MNDVRSKKILGRWWHARQRLRGQPVSQAVVVCCRRFNGFIAQFIAGCFVPLKWITFREEDFLRSSSGLMLGWPYARRLNLVITEFRKVIQGLGRAARLA